MRSPFTGRRIRSSRWITPSILPAPTLSSSYSNGPPRCNSATGWTGRACWKRCPVGRRVVIDCDGALQRPHRVRRRLQPPHRGIQPLLDGCLRQPVGQDFPADLPTAAEECPPVPVPHLRPDLGNAARFRRQGIRHDLCGPHQVPLARHVQGAAGDRAGTGPCGSRCACRGGLGRTVGLDEVG